MDDKKLMEGIIPTSQKELTVFNVLVIIKWKISSRLKIIFASAAIGPQTHPDKRYHRKHCSKAPQGINIHIYLLDNDLAFVAQQDTQLL